MVGGREKRYFNLALKTRAAIDYRHKGQAERDAHQGTGLVDLPYPRYSHWDHLSADSWRDEATAAGVKVNDLCTQEEFLETAFSCPDMCV